MKAKELLQLGKTLGLAPDRAQVGIALGGQLDGVPVSVKQYAIAMGPDPRPRPLTELSVEERSPWRGGLFGVASGHRGDTGDQLFDDQFYWMPHPGLAEAPRPPYLASAQLRQDLLALDGAIAAAIGHQGIPVFQIDHLERTTRMMILTHLPNGSLLEQALRLLVALVRP